MTYSVIADCATFDGINMCDYESHEDMYCKLDTLAKTYPRLARLGTVGKSVQGRELLYIKISANVNNRTRLEPMFKYVGKIKMKILCKLHYTDNTGCLTVKWTK